MDSERRTKMMEQYGADNLEYIVNEYEETLEEETDFDEETVFGSALVASIRTAGFSLTCGEVSRRLRADEEVIREGVEVIKDSSEYVERDIEVEDSSEYLILFINNHAPSVDFANIVQTLYDEVVWDDTPVSEALEDVDNRTEAGTIAWIASHTSHRPSDSLTFYEAGELFHTDAESIRDCYHQCWEKHGYKLKDRVLDDQGVIKHIREDIAPALELTEDEALNAVYAVYELEEYENYNNKAVASAVVNSETDYSIEDCAVSCNEATARRIGERLGLL